MAAYGALVSLMHIIDRIEHHPSPPISIHKRQVESLTQNVTNLQEFLDGYISPLVEADPLESRIADAAHAAEDVIESQIVAQIDNRDAVVEPEQTNCLIKFFGALCNCASIEDDFYHDLQKVIEEMNLIREEVKKIAAEAQLRRKVSGAITSSSTSTVKDNTMVGFDEVFLEVLDKLAEGGQLNRQIIPITGMGGIGKTTLARNIFENALVKERFDIRAWTTISQTYNVRETLREVLLQASGDSGGDLSEDQLGLKLHKHLWGRRYLIIMDDMWSVEVWDKMRFFFPDHNDGSRIIITTRLSNLTWQLNEPYGVSMKFLDEASSWGLFCKTVFEGESFPHELESIGKNIVANCKGLPLSIATIGGLLAKSERTREYWGRIEQNLNSIVITNNDEFCLKTLRLSYIYLPTYLKPCFLYMSVFEEDRSIRVSTLKKLWVSEGFLKPMSGKCLETIAQDYLKELVDRNLIIVDKLGSIGNIKYCKMHDLLRDLCLKEVERERFYRVIKYTPVHRGPRQIIFPDNAAGFSINFLSHVRSVICDGDYRGIGASVLFDRNNERVQMSQNNLRLLRIFKAYDKDTTLLNEVGRHIGGYFLLDVFQLVNLRYLAVSLHWNSDFTSSIRLLWNLHTLIIHYHHPHDLIAPVEIWKLHQLRHLEFIMEGLSLPNPPSCSDNDIVIMENLHTLKGARNLCLNDEVVKRIPNVKKLELLYMVKQVEGANCLNYLQCLNELKNLESFSCFIQYGCDDYLQGISFPHSLKKLCLSLSSDIELEEILQKIGSLPLLQKLVSRGGFFKSRKWETTEGQFQSLKFLELGWCGDLEDWMVAESSHFPLLQDLNLDRLTELKEIPSEVGGIPTLKSICLEYCCESVTVSAKAIVEEQEDLCGDQLDLRVRALVHQEEEALKSLANAYFEVKVREY